jgi:AbrB family looped-hinge helix DNA binding protein
MMPSVKIHYEGWVALPEALRQQLGLSSGDRLDAELVDGAIVLRPATKANRPAPRREQETGADAPARRKPGRPRKQATAAGADPVTLPKRPRGRPRKVRPPEPAPVPPVSPEPWKLRRKEDLQARATPEEPAPPPPLPRARDARDASSPAEERRPFRNVEVRKLGPGRRHNQPAARARPVHSIS